MNNNERRALISVCRVEKQVSSAAEAVWELADRMAELFGEESDLASRVTEMAQDVEAASQNLYELREELKD